MSLTLVIAIALLIFVGGLAWMQRRGQVQPRRSAVDPTPPAPAASESAPPAEAEPPFPQLLKPDGSPRDRFDDPSLGVFVHDGLAIWQRIEEVEFADTVVFVALEGDASGPSEAAREYARIALAQQDDLDQRARAAIVAEATRRHVDAGWMEAYDLQVHVDDDGVLRGRLTYDVMDRIGAFGVASSDLWRTLSVETDVDALG